MAAEALTGGALIAAGWGLLTGRAWGCPLYLLANGALIYTLIQRPGYYLQLGEMGFLAMFALLLLATLGFLAKVAKEI